MTNRSNELFIGSYSSSEHPGIHKAILHHTGEIKLEYGVKGIENPSFLAVHGQNSRLYAVSEQETGQVIGYGLDHSKGTLLPLGSFDTLGGSPCHLAIDHVRRLLFVANYQGGNIVVYSLSENGIPDKLLQNIQHEGRSVHAERQNQPHPHSVNVDPTSRYLFVPDLGLDEIVIYRIQEDKDASPMPLQLHDRVTIKPGAGPRHFAFHPAGDYACVVNELDSTVTLYTYEADGGHLHELQTISTLTAEASIDNTCAHVQFSADGQYVYASNRGHDSIAVFAFDRNQQRLELVQLQATKGRTPRHFSLSPDGRYLLVANQQSDSVVTFHVDSSGRLHDTGYQISVPRPVCIVWNS